MDTGGTGQTGGADTLPTPSQQATYRVTVRGAVPVGWPAPVDGTAVDREGDTTTFTVIADQAALRGILCQLWDLNATLIAAVWVRTEPR